MKIHTGIIKKAGNSSHIILKKEYEGLKAICLIFEDQQQININENNIYINLTEKQINLLKGLL